MITLRESYPGLTTGTPDGRSGRDQERESGQLTPFKLYVGDAAGFWHHDASRGSGPWTPG
jgi:hypothetical protein